MKSTLARCLLAALLCALPFLSGCMIVTAAQLEGKIPRVDAEEISVSANTIYGVTGSLTEKNVKWDGDRKTVGSSELLIGSPGGSYHRTIKGAVVTAAKPSAPAPAVPAPAPAAP